MAPRLFSRLLTALAMVSQVARAAPQSSATDRALAARIDGLARPESRAGLQRNRAPGPAVTWQLRQQLRWLAGGGQASSILRPPPVARMTDDSARMVGSYGDPSDPVTIAILGGKRFRDENEFYPIAGGQHVVPGSGTRMCFDGGDAGGASTLVTTFGDGRETRLPRLPSP